MGWGNGGVLLEFGVDWGEIGWIVGRIFENEYNVGFSLGFCDSGLVVQKVVDKCGKVGILLGRWGIWVICGVGG